MVREAAPGQAGGWSWAGRRWGGKPGDAGPEVEVLYFRSLLDAEEDGGRVVLPSFEP